MFFDFLVHVRCSLTLKHEKFVLSRIFVFYIRGESRIDSSHA